MHRGSRVPRIRRFFMAAVAAAAAVIATGGVAADDALHGAAAYDSGWRDLSVGFNNFAHDLGGSSDDYVVDVQLRDLGESPSVHLAGHGGDSFATAGGNETIGVTLYSLTSSSAFLWRSTNDVAAHQARVKIWLAPSPDYDSGWTAVSAGSDLTLSHGLGGSTDDYVVDLTFMGGSPARVHKGGYGGDSFWSSGAKTGGAYWHNLTTSSVKVHRAADDSFCSQVRVRLFRRQNPDYDSGWQSIAAAGALVIDHGLGGPWNDLVVDVQLKDTAVSGMGVNHRGFGGDRIPVTATDSVHAGTHWYELTGSRVMVYRHGWDAYADQVRVRVWQDRAPKYDSGWTNLPIGVTTPFAHSLGGDPDMYVVDMGIKDPTYDFGVHSLSYGGDTYNNISGGVEWFSLTDSAVYLLRRNQGTFAAQARVRLWHAPMPDYDSGWRDMTPGQTRTLTHDLGGVASDYVVDLQARSAGLGRHHGSYGGDSYDDSGGTPRSVGFCWRALTNSSVDVQRRTDDDRAEQVRLRIWKNTAFDYFTAWNYTDPGQWIWTHNLGVPVDDLVVDLNMESDFPTTGKNHLFFGGDGSDSIGDTEIFGAWWDRLTSTTLRVNRGLDDIHSGRIRVRLWVTPAMTLFADGFESGTTDAWSSVQP